MKVLLIGNGGREHALAWKLAQSPIVSDLYIAPGNPGTEEFGHNVEIGVMDFAKIEKFTRENSIGLVVVGPEDPLVAGLTDHLQKTTTAKVFGPSKVAAQLEGDKWFAKELMRHQAVPTAEARVFTDAKQAEEYVRTRNAPVVVKASGLAKGKGVTVCANADEAVAAIGEIMRKKVFGEAGTRVVIEEKLAGPEVSLLAFVDGRSIYVMESAQDHKPINDGDTGPMTGGMGAYSPTPILTDKLLGEIERQIFVPVIDGLNREGAEFRGILYAGLMLTSGGPKVIEFNCRFGDPETQPLMMRLKSDIAQAMIAVVDQKLDEITLEWDRRPALAVVAASPGYPGKYPTNLPITGIEAADAMKDVKVFQAGTKLLNGKLVTDGGRVLAVTALGDTIAQAQTRAYEAIAKIGFEGMQYRKDIGHRAIK